MMTNSRLPERFRDKEYRDAFVEANIGDTISSQVFALRKKREWSQKELADAAGMAQARISLIESPGYSTYNITTLRRLAAAFDVALIVKFAPFSELVAWLDELSPAAIEVPNFNEEAEAQAKAAFPLSEAYTVDQGAPRGSCVLGILGGSLFPVSILPVHPSPQLFYIGTGTTQPIMGSLIPPTPKQREQQPETEGAVSIGRAGSDLGSILRSATRRFGSEATV